MIEHIIVKGQPFPGLHLAECFVDGARRFTVIAVDPDETLERLADECRLLAPLGMVLSFDVAAVLHRHPAVQGWREEQRLVRHRRRRGVPTRYVRQLNWTAARRREALAS